MWFCPAVIPAAGPSFHGTSSSSSSHSSCAPVASPRSSRGRRSHTPPPARAVAVPLQDQLAADAEFRPDLVKVHMKCQYTTAFGQQLKVVGGAPELGEWDLARVSSVRGFVSKQGLCVVTWSAVLQVACSTCRKVKASCLVGSVRGAARALPRFSFAVVCRSVALLPC